VVFRGARFRGMQPGFNEPPGNYGLARDCASPLSVPAFVVVQPSFCLFCITTNDSLQTCRGGYSRTEFSEYLAWASRTSIRLRHPRTPTLGLHFLGSSH